MAMLKEKWSTIRSHYDYKPILIER
jgi:hypothetical protein